MSAISAGHQQNIHHVVNRRPTVTMSLARIWKRHAARFILGFFVLVLLIVLMVGSNENGRVGPTDTLGTKGIVEPRTPSLNDLENTGNYINASTKTSHTKLYPERLNVSERESE